MIAAADQRLRAWVQGVLADARVSFAAPAAGPEVNLLLLDFVEAPPVRTAARQVVRVMLRYLVTVAASDAEEGHRMLGELLYAALTDGELKVELGAVPAAIWRGFGVAPRPGFAVLVSGERERPAAAPAPRVQRLEVSAVPLVELYGVVHGPDDAPLAGALVELPALGRSARSDAAGQFHLAAVPAGSTVALRLRARGRQLEIAATAPRTGGESITLHLPSLED